MIGLTLANRYELLEKIGDGGMSVVYKARCHILNRDVAVKILKDEFKDDKGLIDRFDKEAKAAASIQHANIVNIYDVGVQDDVHYIVMELVSAKTLKDYIKSQNVFLKNKQIIKVALQVAEALQVAHDKGIVHRDIKPQNILMTQEGVAKVADFGIARAVTSSTIVNTNEAIGSVHYASPEQSRGGFVDKRSDIYSYGVTLYELVTGRVPFEGETPISVALKHLKEAPIPPSLVNIHLNPSLEKIVMKCIHKEPGMRYQNVYEIIEQLERLSLAPDKEIVFTEKTTPVNGDTAVLPRVAFYDESIVTGEDIKKGGPKGIKSFFTVKSVFAIVMGIIVGLMILVFTMVGRFRNITHQAPFEMLQITEKSFTEASTLLSEKGLYLEKNNEIYTDDIPVNHIIHQSPEAGIMVKAGQKVLVDISLGPKLNVMPNLKNQTVDRARVMVENIKGTIVDIEEVYDDLPQGFIISQTPVAGSEVPERTSVKVIVSLGTKSELIPMPNIIERSKEDAIRLLNDLGLNRGSIGTEYSDKISKGYVISQSVDPNSKIEAGTVVNMVISLGPENQETTADPNAPVTKTFRIPLKDDKDIYVIKVTQVIDGTENILHDGIHRKEEKQVPIEVTGNGEVHLRFYIDDVLDEDKIVYFGQE